MFENYKPFMPKTPLEGRIGFYPCADKEEWRALPLPLRCATWYRSDVESVIFDAWFDNYGIKTTVEVPRDDVFKALFTLSGSGTQLYSVVGIRTKDGKRLGAKWLQDTTSGAFAICTAGKRTFIATQGGFNAHMPQNCKAKSGGGWELAGNPSPTTRFCLA